MIRVVLPAHLKTLVRQQGDVVLDIEGPVTLGSVVGALDPCSVAETVPS